MQLEPLTGKDRAEPELDAVAGAELVGDLVALARLEPGLGEQGVGVEVQQATQSIDQLALELPRQGAPG